MPIAKFSLRTTETDDEHTVTTLTHWTTAQITTNSTTVTVTSTATTIIGTQVGSTLFYIVVGAGSGVLILLLVILIMCMAVCCLAADKGKSYTITTAAMHRQETQYGERDVENPEQRWPQTQGVLNVIKVIIVIV